MAIHTYSRPAARAVNLPAAPRTPRGWVCSRSAAPAAIPMPTPTSTLTSDEHAIERAVSELKKTAITPSLPYR